MGGADFIKGQLCVRGLVRREEKKKLEIQPPGKEWQGGEHVTTGQLRGAWPGYHCSLIAP